MSDQHSKSTCMPWNTVTFAILSKQLFKASNFDNRTPIRVCMQILFETYGYLNGLNLEIIS